MGNSQSGVWKRDRNRKIVGAMVVMNDMVVEKVKPSKGMAKVMNMKTSMKEDNEIKIAMVYDGVK